MAARPRAHTAYQERSESLRYHLSPTSEDRVQGVKQWLADLLPHLRPVWRLSLPVILANLLQSLVNVVDVFMAGRLGPIEIAAVGMGNSVRMLFMVGIMAVTAGTMALAAQAKGAGDRQGLSQVARQSLSLAVLLALVLSLLGFVLAEPVLGFLNSDGDPRAVELGTNYLHILFAGTVLLVLNLTINALMQGAGDTLTPLYITGGINLANILFNYLFMFGPGPLPALGVPGAALGTVAARLIGVTAGLLIFYSGRNVVRILPGSYRPDLGSFREILSIGIPSGLQGIVRNSAQVVVVRLVTSTAAGTYGATALAIGLQAESLAFMPGLAISVAATSLVGQSLGAWQLDTARQRGDAALLLGMAVMTLIGIPLFLFAPALVRLFEPTAHPVVLSAGTSYLRINALTQPILAVAMVCNGALRGAGDTRPGLVGTTIGRLLVVLPLGWLLAFPAGLGVEGVWWALAAGTAIQAAWVWLRWRGERWPQVGLRKSRLFRMHLRHLPERERHRYLTEIKAPLMAQDAREVVAPEGVTYQLPDGEVRFEFGRGYRVSEGERLLASKLGRHPAAERREAQRA